MNRSPRIEKLVANLYANMPEIEAARAVIVTHSYMQTEALPTVLRRAMAFAAVLENLPITIRDHELIVGSPTLAPRGCQTFPEFSYEWLEKEFATIATRTADPFYISEKTCAALKTVHPYWKGRTVSDLAAAQMCEQAKLAMDHGVFTVGNYFYNGVGHVNVAYDKVIKIGYEGIIKEVEILLENCQPADADYTTRKSFLDAVIISCEAVIHYANRYATLAEEMALTETDSIRKSELMQIALNCRNVPARGAQNFYEACQSFWFVQMLVQLESSGHSISPGRFDQYMYPYYASDNISPEFAQELIDCIWVKLNDLNKARDAASAEGFSGYGLFQNLIVGGQDTEGCDATNDISYMCIEATSRVFLPQPSLSVRVWNGTPQKLLLEAAKLTRTGIGLPAYFNDEVIIPSMMNRGISLTDARDYCIIGCVEPQKGGKTDGWHDAAFFNMCRPLELVFSNGYERGKLVGVETGDVASFATFEELLAAYETQMEYQISLLVNANNAVDIAHSVRGPMPFLSAMVDDCMVRCKTVQEGGAVYNFTGPQGFGIANVADSFYAIKMLVFEQQKYTLGDFKKAMAYNFGKSNVKMISDIVADVVQKDAARNANSGRLGTVAHTGSLSGLDIRRGGHTRSSEDYALTESLSQTIQAVIEATKPTPQDQLLCDNLLTDINALPKFGNDIDDVDDLARKVAYTYSRPMEKHKNPRSGTFQAGLYPVSANVPLGAQTGATPDGRLAGTPIADGVSPTAGKDINGPTAAANSVAKLDHGIASNGTLFNQKFHPSALQGAKGLNSFVNLIRSFFDQKGMHMQFNVVDRDTLIDAQKNPEKYKNLIVRVAGYSALFTTLAKSLQDDIIGRTEH